MIFFALLILLFPAVGFAQTPAPPPTCEAQLEDARSINIFLKKQKAQAEFQAATYEEMITSLNKKVTELEAKSKPVEKK